jgi:hypothetical protein
MKANGVSRKQSIIESEPARSSANALKHMLMLLQAMLGSKTPCTGLYMDRMWLVMESHARLFYPDLSNQQQETVCLATSLAN